MEIDRLDLPRGAVELLPYLRHLCKASRLTGPAPEPGGEPVPHGVDERRERLWVGAAERIAERMQRHGVDRRKPGEGFGHALAHLEGIRRKELHRAPDAAVRGGRRPGAWLTRRSRARRGGSSRIFRSAFEPCGYCNSSAESTMQMRQPPSPAARPKKPMGRRTSSTVISVR